MCDQDHFEKDREEFEALGLVTRKQFGMMLGAGMACCCRKWRTRLQSSNRM